MKISKFTHKTKFKNILKEKYKKNKKHIERIFPNNFLAIVGYKPELSGLKFPKEKSVLEDIRSKYVSCAELSEIYASHKGCLLHKWHHYLPLYERYFASFKNKKNLKFLEIGVSKGGSLQMWRKYFGDSATIFGIDINPNCKQYDGLYAQVRIGSQNDRSFLKSVISEMGGVDIVLDDGSHQMKHIKESLEILYPYLSKKGIYFIEDLHACYWSRYGGGYYSNNFFRSTLLHIINDMHRWYHLHTLKKPNISKDCSAIHIHDSIVVLEKDITFKPNHSMQY